MLKLKHGIDILASVGQINDIQQARDLFKRKCSPADLAKLSRIEHEEALLKIANAAAMFAPDSIWINSGSEVDLEFARRHAIIEGEEFTMKNPGHTCHYDLPEDQGRMVNQTFYIVNEGESTSVLAKKMARSEAHEYIENVMTGLMRGRIMTVSFWNRGPAGAAASVPAIMITDSFYVVHSGNILYPSVYEDFDQEVKRAGTFFSNCHSMGELSSANIHKARIFMDRSWFTTFSCYCTYAGNTLLLKKGNHRFAVDLCTYYREGSQLSEHMFITGLTGPRGRKTFFAGAAPSGCGKTTTAMVGSDFIGDDLAQMWIDDQGIIRAVNPEVGIFGIIEDVNWEGDPYLMECIEGQKPSEIIFSNILVDEDGLPHWTGDKQPDPPRGRNYLGEWTPDMGVHRSHPNSRFTLACTSIDNYNHEMARSATGIPIRVITYSGRDADTMVPVWVARTPNEGVAIGASIVSKATATEVGATGVSRQPWANAPFIPGPLTTYMAAQFSFYNSPKIVVKPVMAGLNYFLTHDARGSSGKGLLGEKRDVKVWLGWLELYANGDVTGIETPIGILPRYTDLLPLFAAISKEYPRALYDMQFSLYVENMLRRLDLQIAAYGKESNLPPQLFAVYNRQKEGLLELLKVHGPIVPISTLDV
ncbi:phosphoenolpyruvate carboxykinase (GTP) [Myxococcota bacterium]|nr:phosphoenolpyruvate carboxykinase (GTP) [Myxococcota bacterium]MBU1533782.1 phosphoenolpyruvate carboxykinase (GTP) [Myxococcota bacterium]